jgi:hypothetical protein
METKPRKRRWKALRELAAAVVGGTIDKPSLPPGAPQRTKAVARARG